MNLLRLHGILVPDKTWMNTNASALIRKLGQHCCIVARAAPSPIDPFMLQV
jgi:hypothetical protein